MSERVGERLETSLEREGAGGGLKSSLRRKVGWLEESQGFALSRIPQKYPNLFGILFDLDNFLTLKNENKFSFSSLNRNFALPL